MLGASTKIQHCQVNKQKRTALSLHGQPEEFSKRHKCQPQHNTQGTWVPSASFLSHHFCHNRSNSHLPLHVKEMINQRQMYYAQPYDNSINYSLQQSVNTEYFTNSPITRDCDSGQTSAVVSMLQTQDGCRFRLWRGLHVGDHLHCQVILMPPVVWFNLSGLCTGHVSGF